MQITTIGLDIAKNVFQVHGIDANEKVVTTNMINARILPHWFLYISRDRFEPQETQRQPVTVRPVLGTIRQVDRFAIQLL
jgi:hypothetical protein